MTFEEPIVADPSYSLDDAIKNGVAFEAMYAHLDLGPVDTLDPVTLQAEYDLFFGTSPLSSQASSPTPSRSASPTIPAFNEATHDKHHLARSLNSPSRRSPLPVPEDQRPESKPPLDARHEPVHGKAAKRREKSHANRRRKRQEAQSQQDKNTVPYANRRKHIARAESIATSYDTNSIPSASSGFIALRDGGERGSRVHEASELLENGEFRLIEWNGMVVRAIVDKDGRIIAVLAGRPNDSNWDSVHKSSHAALQSARKRCRFPKKATSHRRGNFPALNTGISFGGGQKLPGNLHHSKTNKKELDKLLQHKSIKRIAGFGSKALLTWAPKLHAFYAKNFDDLLHSNAKLRRNFDNSIWAAAAFNFGPKTCSLKHRDFANLPFGWCSITALGDFDPTQGGHLVLWDLKLVIQFPPGSTILLPSAAIAHSNTNIGRRETRSSFTQFTAGGLFRWTAHGGQPDAEYFRGMTAADIDRIASENAARCKFGLSLFSTFEEIRESLGIEPRSIPTSM